MPETAELLKVSDETVRRYCVAGRLVARRVDPDNPRSDWRVSEKSVTEMLNKRSGHAK